MELNQNAKQKYSTIFPKVTAIAKGLAAFLTLLTTFLFLVYILESINKGTDGTDGGLLGGLEGSVTGMSVSVFLIMMMPMFVIAGTGVLWTVAILRSTSPKSNGRILDSSAVFSLSSSLIGAFGCIAASVYLGNLITAINESKQIYQDEIDRIQAFGSSRFEERLEYDLEYIDFYNYIQSLAVFVLIILIAGSVCLVFNSIFRKLYYSSVEKTFKGESSSCKMTIPYIASRFLGAAIKIAVFVFFIVLKADGKNHHVPKSSDVVSESTTSGSSMDGLALAVLIIGMAALVIGAAANIVEALMAKKYSGSLGSSGNAPYGYPYSVAPAANPYEAAPADNPYGAAPAGNPYGAAPAANPYEAAPNWQEPVQHTVAADNRSVTSPTCPFCGAPDNGVSKFCMKCGSRLR